MLAWLSSFFIKPKPVAAITNSTVTKTIKTIVTNDTNSKTVLLISRQELLERLTTLRKVTNTTTELKFSNSNPLLLELNSVAVQGWKQFLDRKRATRVTKTCERVSTEVSSQSQSTEVPIEVPSQSQSTEVPIEVSSQSQSTEVPIEVPSQSSQSVAEVSEVSIESELLDFVELPQVSDVLVQLP